MKKFEVFIADNDPATIEGLTTALRHFFGDLITVVCAATVAQGERILRERGSGLDAAILDFHYPSGQGGHIDETLCRLIQTESRHTLVFHYTGFMGHERILSHFRRYHQGDGHYNFSKVPTEQELRLVPAVVQALFSKRVGELLDRLGSYPQQFGIVGRGEKDLFLTTQELIWTALESWTHLSPHVKDRLRTSLQVDQTKDPPRLGLLDEAEERVALNRIVQAGAFDLHWSGYERDFQDAAQSDYIEHYAAVLRSSPPRGVAANGKIPALVKNVRSLFRGHDESFSDIGNEGGVYLVLPAWPRRRQSSKVQGIEETLTAAATRFAGREGSRSLSLRAFNGRRPPPAWWWWINAVAELSSARAAWRFHGDAGQEPEGWLGPNDQVVVKPYGPLDSTDQRSDTWIFVDYLTRRFALRCPELPEAVLSLAATFPDPWAALEALLGEDFDGSLNLFADFARDAYFLGDRDNAIDARLGASRFPCELVPLHPHRVIERKYVLDHLCRICPQLVAPEDEPDALDADGHIEVVVSCDDARARTCILPQLFQSVAGSLRRQYLFRTEISPEGPEGVAWRFRVPFEESLAAAANEKVTWDLIVANTGMRPEHDQMEAFVSARFVGSGAGAAS